MQLPETVQEIADVIGREAALYLIGQLPRYNHSCASGSHGTKWRTGKASSSIRVILYVPKKLKPGHLLSEILGPERAQHLVDHFGGEILKPANCNEVYRRFRDAEVRRLANDNYTPAELASIMQVSQRTITNLMIEKPPEDQRAANDNTRRD